MFWSCLTESVRPFVRPSPISKAAVEPPKKERLVFTETESKKQGNLQIRLQKASRLQKVQQLCVSSYS